MTEHQQMLAERKVAHAEFQRRVKEEAARKKKQMDEEAADREWLTVYNKRK
jgi:hypothetical protein